MTRAALRGRERCARCASSMARMVIWANFVLGLFKLVVGYLSNSAAISADGVQSFACAFIGVLVAKSMKIGQRQADADYPFGYGKVEFLVSFISFSLLFGLGVFVFVSSTALIINGRNSPPEVTALLVALISVAGNYLMFRACGCAGTRTRSAGLLANSKQNRADMLSSMAVVVGVGLCQIFPEYHFFDGLAAAVVAVMIMVDAAHNWWADMQVLIDKPLDGHLQRRLESVAVATDGVARVDFVSSRRTARGTWVELGLVVAPEVTVHEARLLASEVRGRLLRRIDWLDDVEVFASAS